MKLHVTHVGSGTPRVAFLHGLLGRGKNWATVAKTLADRWPSLLYDLPNHGRSPWTDDLTYPTQADALAADLRRRGLADGSLVIVGHSMGGKVAMTFALRHPDMLRGLVVIDIAPDHSLTGYGFGAYVDALKAVDLDQLTRRVDADTQLAATVASPATRAFLLQNLHRESSRWRWLPHLDLIRYDIGQISAWPEGLTGPWEGPTLWVRGGDSDYVRDEHGAHMRGLFPRVRLVTIKNAGHWVHADQPEALTRTLAMFLAAVDAEAPVG